MAKKGTPDSACVLTLPMYPEKWQADELEKRFRNMEKMYNALVALESRKLRNLQQTKAYRALDADLFQLYKAGQTKSKEYKEKSAQRRDMLKDAKLTEYDFIDDITPFVDHYYPVPEGMKLRKRSQPNLGKQVAHRTASDVWRAFDKLLYGNGHRVAFKKKDTLSSIGCKKAGNGMQYRDNQFEWFNLRIPVRPPETEYEKATVKRELRNMRVVRKWMKNRYRYYLQLTYAGEPVSKGHPRGEGRVGIDIGTQSIAIAAKDAVLLRELAPGVKKKDREIRRLQRAIDRSRRATNPDNFDSAGRIRPGAKKNGWVKSHRYLKLQGRLRELHRKNADIRKQQHYELCNLLLSLGDEFYVEDMDYRALQKRSQRTEKNEKGRFRKKKRFGKSLANKAPAALLTMLNGRLQAQGGLKKVDKWSYAASQYDHLSHEYRKPQLSQRIKTLTNGDQVQRDMYSAFLIMNADHTLTKENDELCNATYDRFKIMHDREMERLRTTKERKLSSFGV